MMDKVAKYKDVIDAHWAKAARKDGHQESPCTNCERGG